MRSKWRGITLLLGWFAGLCTLFALVATGFDAWREHVRAGWPAIQAQIAQCEIREYHSSGKSFYIRCDLAYAVAGQAIKAQVRSKTVPDPARVIWSSAGTPQLGDLQAWVDAHPAGTATEVHYDPAAPQTAALVNTDMPLGGPRAPADWGVVRLFGVLCLVLLVIGGVRRRASLAPQERDGSL